MSHFNGNLNTHDAFSSEINPKDCISKAQIIQGAENQSVFIKVIDANKLYTADLMTDEPSCNDSTFPCKKTTESETISKLQVKTINVIYDKIEKINEDWINTTVLYKMYNFTCKATDVFFQEKMKLFRNLLKISILLCS